MDVTSATGSVFSAFGLSGAAGLNAWIPLLATGILQRSGVLELQAPYDKLGTTPALVIIAVLLVVDLIGDKVPVVDSVLHSVGLVVAPIVGAIIFAGDAGSQTDIPTILSLIAGSAITGSVHLARSAFRPVSTATTGGVANPVVSLIEDGASLGLTAIAFLLPVLAFLAVVGVLILLALSWRTLRDRWRARQAEAQRAGESQST